VLIAFVGSEASGKSTIIAEMARRLAERGPVIRVHVGRPPSTALTFLPHVLLPAFRKLFPEQRTTHVEIRTRPSNRSERGRDRPVPMLFAVRSVMLAYERRALLVRATRRAVHGRIVLSDRFPPLNNGFPDGPQLGDLLGAAGLRGRLASIEARCYRDIPRAKLVIQLTAPLEVTLARNAAREKYEPEEYVVRRHHVATSSLEFDGARVERIDTDRPLDDTLREVEAAIRDAMEAVRP
jgi:thymidylate kinase